MTKLESRILRLMTAMPMWLLMGLGPGVLAAFAVIILYTTGGDAGADRYRMGPHLEPATPPPPRVLLLGDSVRIGYQREVRAALAGKATVCWPVANCGTSGDLRRRLDGWLRGEGLLGKPGAQARWDVIVVNAGLHDVRRDYAGDEFEPDPRSTTPQAYYENVGDILAACQATGARVMWASTTPVVEDRYAAWFSERWPADWRERRNADIDAYNVLARRACSYARVDWIDLGAVIREAGTAGTISEDGIHPNAEGAKRLAEALAAGIRPNVEQRMDGER